MNFKDFYKKKRGGGFTMHFKFHVLMDCFSKNTVYLMHNMEKYLECEFARETSTLNLF